MEGRMLQKGQQRIAISCHAGNVSRRYAHYLPLLFFIFCILAFSAPAFSAPLCAVPGKDGPASPSGFINTYYPGTASVSAGAASIPVGFPSGDFSNLITTGDLLLVIQMQDADINTSNNSSYGGSGSGSGYTSLNQAGAYEYVMAAGPVSGGYVPISGNLTNSYRSRAASASNGQSTFQVIRVPQYSTATVSGTVSALPWNGAVGGIVAMDVAGTLTINGTITANGAGFRGGWGESSNTTGPDTDYRTRATILGNGMKGEGIAGTPNRMNQPTGFNGAPNQVTTGTSVGYPDGVNSDAAKGRGAPGNAGGGGTDGNTANDENSGGGGGGNFAAGAKGGNSWSSNLPVGGEGGSAVTGLAFNRVVMGGGGGAGTTNNGTADSATYFTPAGLSCTAGDGDCSSGAPGGGIILLRANALAGSGMVTANGGSGYNVLNDSAGGGGAGGSVVIDTQAGGSLTVYANGGDGGNAWRSHTTLIDRHGPGGGGSGGFLAYSPASGFAVSATVNGGTSGKSCNNDAYGSTSSSGGIYTFLSPNTSGPKPGAACVPNLSTSTKSVVDLNGGGYEAGDVLRYTITLNESNGAPASGVSVTDNIDVSLTNFTVISFPAGAANNSTGTGTGANGTGYLNITGINVPANGSETIVFTADISGTASPGTTINNTASVTVPLGTGGYPVAPVVTVAGTIPASGTKQLYLNAGNALSRPIPPPNTGSFVHIPSSANTSVTWSLTTATAKAMALSSSFSVYLQMRRPSGTGNRSLALTIDYVNGGTTVTLGTGTVAGFSMTNGSTPTLYGPFTVYLGTSPVTIPAGSTLRLTVQNTSGGTRPIDVYPNYNRAVSNFANISRMELSPTPVINIDSIGLYKNAYNDPSTLASVNLGESVYIRATASDPFGFADISGAAITITDSGGAVRVIGAALDPAYLRASTGAIKTYEYLYAVPSTGVPTGGWTIRITATEGTEGVSATGYATMPVVIPQPSLTVVKSASPSPAVNSGQVVTYTVLVTNTGQGAATDVLITDSLSPYASWSMAGFTFNASSSGLTLGTPAYSSNSGVSWVYTPTSGGGGAPAGYDANVTNWRIPMTGTMNANGANFSINYQVRIN
jgi:uncharacterized repeat protein (TIGR01451 family)/fimbrial isopeptide formation D2 family protein